MFTAPASLALATQQERCSAVSQPAMEEEHLESLIFPAQGPKYRAVVSRQSVMNTNVFIPTVYTA